MNLVTRFTILFILVSLMVFLVGGVITFQVMKREIDAEQQRFLLERLNRIVHMIDRRDIKDDMIREKFQIRILDRISEESEVAFSDTLVMHNTLERLEPHLKLDVIRTINNRSYAITIYDVIVETDDINDVVIESLVKTFLILLVAFAGLGLVVSFYQLRPFRQTLQIIRSFTISGKDPPVFPKTSIREFRKLNAFLDEMTMKVQKDYHALKEFSENASHELQTPLAIIQSKLDVLIQEEGLNEKQLKLIESAQLTARRLSSLSSSLSLLTKIENHEFSKKEKIDFTTVVYQVLDEFSELLSLKGIHYTVENVSSPTIEVDPVLIQIMITNLLNNAIKHNLEKGSIHIKIDRKSATISNTGKALETDPNELFERFRKSNQSDTSLGLGLAIVKKICDLYGFKIKYSNKSEQHTLSLVFNGGQQ